MKTLRWAVLLGSFGFVPVAWAQEPTKPEADTKKDSGSDGDQSNVHQALQDKIREMNRAQREVQDAQRAVAKAQADVASKHAAIGRANAPRRFVYNFQVGNRPGAAGPQQGKQVGNRPGAAGPQQGKPNQGSRAYSVVHSNDLDRRLGLDLAPADPALRAQLGLPATEGLVVTRLTVESPAGKAGLRKDDVIVKLDGKSAHFVPEAFGLMVNSGKSTFPVNLFRAGKPVELTWTKPEPPASKEPYYLGVVLAPVDATLRAQLPALPEDAGIIVTEVTPNSPAARAEVHQYDVIYQLNDKPLKSGEASSLTEPIQKGGGQPIQLGILRAGQAKVLTVTPERRPATPSDRLEEAAVRLDGMLKDLDLEMGRGPNSPPISIYTMDNGKRIEYIPYLNQTGRPDAKSPAEVSAPLEKQVRDLGKQMDDLQKAIEAMSRSLKPPPADGKEAKEKGEK